MSELFASLSGIVDASGLSDDPDDIPKELVIRRFSSEQLIDPLTTGRRYMRQRCDQRKRHFVLTKVQPTGFSRHGLIGRVVENVVGDLEGHTEPVTKLRERPSEFRCATEGATFACSGNQRGGLGADQVAVVR